MALAGACLSWAIDNNLTRKVSASDALFIAGSHGLVTGCVNTGLAFELGAAMPSATLLSSATLMTMSTQKCLMLTATGMTRTINTAMISSGVEPHTHAHQHTELKHRHAHSTDIHHQHSHS